MPDIPFSSIKKFADVSQETIDRIETYYHLLIKWQKKINLIGDGEIWTRHFLDSAQLFQITPRETKCLVDFGSGAGFPGMVLAILGIKNVNLIESDGKKISFLQELSRVTKTDVKIYHGRIENFSIDNVDVITARACSELSELLNYAHRYVSHGTTCLFPKGKKYSTELKGASKLWKFDCEIIPSAIDPEGVILKLSALRKIP